jgi:hypothetical protein
VESDCCALRHFLVPAVRLGRGGAADPALQQQLLALYDQYNKAIQAGKLADATALRTAASRAEIEKELKRGKKAQAEFIEMSKQMVPDSVEVLHATISRDAMQATILTLGARAIPAMCTSPAARSPARSCTAKSH